MIYITMLAVGTMTVPWTIRKKEDAKALCLTDKEAGEIVSYQAPAGKEEEFDSALANIFAAWPVYEKMGLSKTEMAGRVHDELSGKTSEEPLTTEIPLRDILLPAGTVTTAGLYSTGIPGVFSEEKTVDFTDESERTAFVHGLEKNNVLPVGGSVAALATLGALAMHSGGAQKTALNRALMRALSQYKAIAMSTGMPIGEVVQTAAKAAVGELPDTTLGRRIAYELTQTELTQNASKENKQIKEQPIDDIFSRTLKTQQTPTVNIGGVSGTALSAKGFDKKSLQETYGYSAQEAQKTEELLHEIRLSDTLPAESLAGIVALTENSRSKVQVH